MVTSHPSQGWRRQEPGGAVNEGVVRAAVGSPDPDKIRPTGASHGVPQLYYTCVYIHHSSRGMKHINHTYGDPGMRSRHL